jgi:hypothetical protein
LNALFKLLVLAVGLIQLTSCGNKSANVNLEVTSSFMTPAGFTGGLIAYGESQSGEKFSASANAGQKISVNLNNGIWSIYVIGWEGSNLKFRGTKSCGASTLNLGSADTNLNLQVSTANCSNAAFKADTEIRALLTTSCGAFYNYDSQNDTFSNLTAAESDNGFCSNLPEHNKSSFTHYRLRAPIIEGNNMKPGIFTECIPTEVPANATRLDVPTKKFPFFVNMYRTLKDCQNIVNPRFASFYFPNGIDSGNKDSFDQHFISTQTAGNARLALPSTFTRRGYSPFINMQPRILCGSSDCFKEPSLPSISAPAGTSQKAQFSVRWQSDYNWKDSNDNNSHLILKGFAGTQISSNTCNQQTLNFLNQNKNFAVRNCSIENGDLRGQFIRNELVCKKGGDLSGVIDLYERDGRIYLVQKENSPNKFKILVYSVKGEILDEIRLENGKSLNTNNTYNYLYKGITVTPDKSVFALFHRYQGANGTENSRQLFKFKIVGTKYEETSSTNWNSANLDSLDKIESKTDSNFLLGYGDTLKAMVISNTNSLNLTEPAGQKNVGSTYQIKKILFKNNNFYVLSTSISQTNQSQIHSSSISGTSIGSTSTVHTSGDLYQSFHFGKIGDIEKIIFSGDTWTKVYTAGDLSTPTHTANPQYYAPKESILIGNFIYQSVGSTSRTFKTFEIGVSSTLTATSDAGSCEAHLDSSLFITGTDYKLNLLTKESGTTQIIFEEAFRHIGRRDLSATYAESLFTFFESLNRDSGGEDKSSVSGRLGQAQSLLGPDGVGGVLGSLYPETTCSNISTNLAATSVTKSITLFDFIEGKSQTFNFTVSGVTAGDEGLIFGETQTGDYDLVIEVNSTNFGETEKLKMKVICADKRGTLETKHSSTDSEDRSLFLWNTAGNTGKYEFYHVENKDDDDSNLEEVRASMVRLNKTYESSTHSIDSRQVEINRTFNYENSAIVPENIEGRVSELHHNGTYLMTTSVNTGWMDDEDFVSNSTEDISTPLGTITLGNMISMKEISALNLNPGACMSATNDTINSTSLVLPVLVDGLTGCTQAATQITNSSKDPSFEFSLEDLEDATDQDGAGLIFYDLFEFE